ncbi:EamA family transporter [Gammaproteobacteria bacterium]|nr:EamA family transporter [Gammaproteobacteria bacterium]
MSNQLLYLISVLIWGSTWFAIEFQLGNVSPEVSIVYRYAIAAAVLFAWSAIRGLSLNFRVRDHRWFMLLGLLLFGLNYVFAYGAQIYISSALNAIVFSMIVWMNIINARLFFGIRAGRGVLIGALMGIMGIITLFSPQIGESSVPHSTWVGLLLAAGGALTSSLGNMTSQAAQRRKLPIIQSNAWGMFYGGAFTAALAIGKGQSFTFEVSFAYIASLLYLAIFGSVVAFGAYLTLLGRIGAHKAGYVMVMFPVVALLLSGLFEGLIIDLSVIFGTLLVLAGNVFVVRSRVVPGERRELNHEIAED